MDVTILERKKVSSQMTLEELEPTLRLADDAQRLLGYGNLQAAVGRPALAAALSGLGIQPFTGESVAAYKAAFPKQVDNPDLSAFYKRHMKLIEILGDVVVGIFLVACFVFVLSAIAGLWWEIGHPTFLKIMPVFLSFACSFVAVIASALLMEKLPWSRLNVTWKRIPIKDYDADIPPHVLARAVSLKKELGIAEFFVEQVEYFPDPFLVVTCGTQEAYIDVWGEEDFERLYT